MPWVSRSYKLLHLFWWGKYRISRCYHIVCADWSCRKTYCSRCEKDFPSQQALHQHYNDSPRHDRCGVCGFDGSTWEEVLKHHRKTQHRVICQGCNEGQGMTWIAGSQEYLAHLKRQNVCNECEEHFESSSNLDHVCSNSSFELDINTGLSIEWSIWNDWLNATAAIGDS